MSWNKLTPLGCGLQLQGEGAHSANLKSMNTNYFCNAILLRAKAKKMQVEK